MGFFDWFTNKTEDSKPSNKESDQTKLIQQRMNERILELKSEGKTDAEIVKILEKEVDTAFGLIKPDPSKPMSIDLNIDLNKIQEDLDAKIDIRIKQLRTTGISDKRIEQMLNREMTKGIGIFREEEDTELWVWELNKDYDHIHKKNCKKCIKYSQYPPKPFGWWYDRDIQPGNHKTCERNCMCNIRKLTEEETKKYLETGSYH